MNSACVAANRTSSRPIPQYFIAANTLNRRVAAVLIRHNQELEACVLFYEHYKFGIGLGIMRGGGWIGENCVAGPEAFRLQYIQFAAEALLQHWRIHGVSISVRAPLDECLEVMGPKSRYRIFFERNVQYKLPLESTYSATLAGMGPRTRRGAWRANADSWKPAHRSSSCLRLSLAQALEAMLPASAEVTGESDHGVLSCPLSAASGSP